MSSGRGTRYNRLRLMRLKNFDDYTNVVIIRLNETYGSECGCKQLRNRCCADTGTTACPSRKGDACRCLGVREIPKISRWIEGIQTIVEYVPGKQHVIADVLSRKPLVGRESRIDDTELPNDIAALVEAVQQNRPVTEDRLTKIRVEPSTDPEMKSITDFIANGWPSHESAVPHSVRDYYRERALLSLNDGVVTYKLQIVMPPKMRDYALRRIHELHQGISNEQPVPSGGPVSVAT